MDAEGSDGGAGRLRQPGRCRALGRLSLSDGRAVPTGPPVGRVWGEVLRRIKNNPGAGLEQWGGGGGHVPSW